MKPILIFFLIASLAGCSTTATPEQKAATKGKWSATGFWLLGKAVGIAQSTVISAAQSYFDQSNKADWLDSLATGIRTKATASFSGDDVSELIGIWTPEKSHWQALGKQLGDAARKSLLPPAQTAEQLAQAMQLAAQAARVKAASFPEPHAAPSPVESIQPRGAPFPIIVTRQ